MKEQDLRLEIFNTLLTTPHRDLSKVFPVHRQMCEMDPIFYVRLAAWYNEKGEVRDHKEMFIVNCILSEFEGHREVGLALLRKLPPLCRVTLLWMSNTPPDRLSMTAPLFRLSGPSVQMTVPWLVNVRPLRVEGEPWGRAICPVIVNGPAPLTVP